MTQDYCKLVSGIILSTIWREDDHTRILWITMLALKDREHQVLASVPGLASVANIPVESCRAGLAKLMSPDPDSRTKEHEGRRISETDGGWLILNGEKYRNFLSKQERNEYQAKLMADRRSSSKMLAPVSRKLAVLAQTETETETLSTCVLKKSPTLDEVKLTCAKAGIPESDAVWFWNKCEGNGWTNGGKKIKSYPHTLAAWKAAGYLPSQKPAQGGGYAKSAFPPQKTILDKELDAIEKAIKKL
jgi:hypothetical protein